MNTGHAASNLEALPRSGGRINRFDCQLAGAARHRSWRADGPGTTGVFSPEASWPRRSSLYDLQVPHDGRTGLLFRRFG
jgi:hypothetical protein